ncbi:MAG: ORF6N domain-containing protein [Luteolibacter sp.]
MASQTLTIQIERGILLLRGQRVMLDFQLADLYQVETRALKQAVRRNLERFPEDFMFELSTNEIDDLVSQNVIPGLGKLGGAVPMAFTEQGVSMLSSVLRSKRAVGVNIAIMRAFVRLRELLATNADLVQKLEQIEKKYDGQFRIVFDAIRQLMAPPSKMSRELGFHAIPKPKSIRKPRTPGN